MNEVLAKNQLAVGSDLFGPVRTVTPERIEWYDSAMLSAAQDKLAQVGANIHTDHQYALTQGLTAVNADGMIMTNWFSSMLVGYFGLDYIERGELRTKYIKPVPLGAVLSVRGRITGIARSDTGTAYTMDIWCEDEHGVQLVVGDAGVDVRAGA